jgi:predicted MFS family arabinose efflux permease
VTIPGAHRILVVLALTNLVGYAARNALFAVFPDLVERYHISDSELGLLNTVFMIPHAAATLGFGWAGDRYDRRRVIAVGLVLASIAGIAGTIGESYLGFTISRAFVGLGTAAIVPVANSILGQVFDGPVKASRLAIFNLGLFVGGVVGLGVGTAVGFPLVVIVLAIPGIVLSAIVMALPVPPHPASGEAVAPRGLSTLLADARELLRIPTLRWVIASTTVMAFAAGGLGAWLQAYLVRPIAQGGKGMPEEDAFFLLALGLCGGLSGILAGARIADRLRMRYVAGRLWTIALGMTLTAPCAAAAILLPAGIPLYVIGILTLFFVSWYHAPMAATVDDVAPARLAVSAQGLVIFTMHMFGTAPSTWVIGLLSEETDLGTALWLPTGLLLVAAGCMLVATRTFAGDSTRARGTPTGASL